MQKVTLYPLDKPCPLWTGGSFRTIYTHPLFFQTRLRRFTLVNKKPCHPPSHLQTFRLAFHPPLFHPLLSHTEPRVPSSIIRRPLTSCSLRCTCPAFCCEPGTGEDIYHRSYLSLTPYTEPPPVVFSLCECVCVCADLW